MHAKNSTNLRNAVDVAAAAKSLAESVERLRARNADLEAYLKGESDSASRVANSPDVPLEDATERARKYWDKLEGRRSSVPPQAR